MSDKRIRLEMRQNAEGVYEWFIIGTDENTGVTGATPSEALVNGLHAWGSPVWNVEQVSDTIIEIDADIPGKPYCAIPTNTGHCEACSLANGATDCAGKAIR